MRFPISSSDTGPFSPLKRRRKGFTLIELLVVIMIIGIVSGIVLTAVGAGDQSRAVDAGITRMDSLFSLARSAAISMQTHTRVIINADPANEDRFLRFATIMYRDREDGNWKLYSDGISLPGGVFFSPAMSSTSERPLFVWGVNLDQNLMLQGSPSPEMTPAGNSTISGENRDPLNPVGVNTWISYEFNPNGTFGIPESGQKPRPLSRVVLVNALLTGMPGNPSLLFRIEEGSDAYDAARGFAVFRSGKQLHFQSADQLREGN